MSLVLIQALTKCLDKMVFMLVSRKLAAASTSSRIPSGSRTTNLSAAGAEFFFGHCWVLAGIELVLFSYVLALLI
ncbi:hypothetical protein QN386_02030 [Pseudomonas sp. CCI3.2]|uniref:hypothetical protein n=1 Tax=unclassified Pseudomonas TaxID=196821 RepID=UPI002AC961E7|nr:MULTISPECIES: hypothetical protein [unclassified Pseudomonas]MEB0076091.1 hypothetical protein [Pseudomonas sp. MH10out]MEB0090802.1 hypothetical protein [Pseudomonas sp. CCI4.2]MEB0100108.1 hypothetical protein [Pseudomonas sp. CCI3.2]MEB0132046.1 hypothetical protein [Pseudomonas sp. CCI2.4]MEB0156155.1 hypothetical protein [Pseudomonas sp. AH2 (2023)]